MDEGVKDTYEISPLQGLKNRAGKDIEITYAPAYKNYMGIFKDWKVINVNELAEDINQPVDDELLKQALENAKEADLVLFFAGTNKSIETEGCDRYNIDLPVSQNKIIEAIAAVNSNIATIIISGGPVDLNVVNKYSPAIVQGWWNGLEGGNALADILFGNIAPSGKLPFTFPVKLDDSPAYALGNYPQKDDEIGRAHV